MSKKEIKSKTFPMRMTPGLKNQALLRQKELGRPSLTNYIEYLIKKDIEENGK